MFFSLIKEKIGIKNKKGAYHVPTGRLVEEISVFYRYHVPKGTINDEKSSSL